MVCLLLMLMLMPDEPEASKPEASKPEASKPPAAIESWLAKQLEAVRKQSPAPAASFFVLPPPGTLLAASLLAAALPECPALGEQELQTLVEEAAHAAGLKPEWLSNLVREKSGGRPCAVSPANAQGLMQLSPGVLDRLKVADPLDPRQNLAAGARLLKELLDSHGGDLGRALAAYNAGESRGTAAPAPAAQSQPAPADKKN